METEHSDLLESGQSVKRPLDTTQLGEPKPDLLTDSLNVKLHKPESNGVNASEHAPSTPKDEEPAQKKPRISSPEPSGINSDSRDKAKGVALIKPESVMLSFFFPSSTQDYPL